MRQSPRQGHLIDKRNKILADPFLPRDDLKAAFAGDENRGPSGAHSKWVTGKNHSTNVKSRKTPKSKSREVIR